jgi:aerobic carbon-monoxide dehydrogenase medium subunit
MKAAAFDYVRASSVTNALGLLALHGERAKVLSGGQSLLPAMNLRLISPELIVDIGDIQELRGIAIRGNKLLLGALTRHADLLRSPEIAAHAPLLTEAIAHVAHPAIRNRGTLGGSLVHADPASELPACMLALDATILVRSQQGERRIPAEKFFTGIYETALFADELLIGVELPVVQRDSVHFFHEFVRRHGDYAIVGIAAQANVMGASFTRIQAAFFAVGDRPVLAESVKKLMNDVVTPALMAEVSSALGAELDPLDDQQASSTMRRHLAKVLLTRCVSTLLHRSDLGTRAA